MSLYNLVNGFNLACVIFLPMLGRKETEYPRFRDCFLSDDNKYIDIYTRVGGNNRNCGYGEEELYKDPNFVSTFDDEFDSTYATYRFSPPERWKSDFDKIIDGRWDEVSDDYINHVKEFFPKLSEVGMIDRIFNK